MTPRICGLCRLSCAWGDEPCIASPRAEGTQVFFHRGYEQDGEPLGGRVAVPLAAAEFACQVACDVAVVGMPSVQAHDSTGRRSTAGSAPEPLRSHKIAC
jgi:hypothetical protein